jgi:peptidoglycan/LPS O-acetylase OafA/YrhL
MTGLVINEPIIESNTFRPGINGLRALAVLLVLLFHLEYPFCSAGYLGVDVFLVISGYLITRNILHDLQQKKFSFTGFYTRRFKRLFPALFFTLSLSLAAGYFLLSPSNLESLARSCFGSVFFFANISFWKEIGYFDMESAFKPLLHIWSLSLEEQFYFIWPLLLFGAFVFFRRKLPLLLIGLLLLSLLLRTACIPYHPGAVFYLLPFRFFEFLLGAACIWLEQYKPRRIIFKEIMVALGLLLIIFSALGIVKPSLWRGVTALTACMGAMTVIVPGETRSSGWLLTNKIAALIGRSSYSIYLIHWPLIVFFKYWTLSGLTPLQKITIGLLSIGIGCLMWRFIENTFRTSKLKFKRTDLVWIWMPAAMALLAFFSLSTWISKGFPSRYSQKFTMTNEQILAQRNNYWDDSGNDHPVLHGSDSRTVIVMGNSHAVDLIYALRNNGFKPNIVSLQTSYHCYDFGTPVEEEYTTECEEKKKINFSNVNWSTADAVFLHDHWPKKDLPDLEKFLAAIRKFCKAPIYVFGPKMIFTQPVPEIVHSCRSSFASSINRYAQAFAEVKQRDDLNGELSRFLKDERFRRDRIYFVDVLSVQGGAEKVFDIISVHSADFLYFDKGHFTEDGATEFGKKLKELYPEIFAPVIP